MWRMWLQVILLLVGLVWVIGLLAKEGRTMRWW